MRQHNSELDISYDNISIDKKVIFVEQGHKYVHIDNPGLKFTSVTTLLKNFKEPFDAIGQARKCCADERSQYFGKDPFELAAEWVAYGKSCADNGTALHSYGESLLNGKKDVSMPDNVKAQWVEKAVSDLFNNGYQLATTEMLVYDTDLQIAGQSDIILKKQRYNSKEFDFQIFDWKFLSKPLDKKSFYTKKDGYRMMYGPFKKLMDCNWVHYSIQLSIYQTLSGDPGRVTEKVMVVVNDDGYSFVPAYPMRVFWDQNGDLQCVHETWNGKWWDSRMDTCYKKKPTDIIGI